MPKVAFYFELHQPFRLNEYTVFDIGRNHEYFGKDADDQNRQVFLKVAEKSYFPMLRVLQHLTKRFPQFVWSLSCSGIFLEQAERFAPKLVTLLQQLVATGQVEVLAETYYHSLSSLYSKHEFFDQVATHTQKMREVFSIVPTTFRNTELIYSDLIGSYVAELGFQGMLTEAVDRYLDGQNRTQLFSSYTKHRIPLMLKHAQLSDDIAFRFSDRNWERYPLNADTYVHWLNQYQENEFINLFMDFETFGEHQWSDTGIFSFFEYVVEKLQQHSWNRFVTPSQAMRSAQVQQLPFYKVPEPISWADIDRDLSAWRDNDLQYDTLRLIYELEEQVKETNDVRLIEDWRKLQTSDHFYYMCIKWSADGDVHAYFSPYQNPMDAYVRYTTVLADIQSRLTKHQESSKHTLQHSRKSFSSATMKSTNTSHVLKG